MSDSATSPTTSMSPWFPSNGRHRVCYFFAPLDDPRASADYGERITIRFIVLAAFTTRSDQLTPSGRKSPERVRPRAPKPT